MSKLFNHFKAVLLLALLIPVGLSAQNNRPQLKTFSINFKGISGFCDSSLTDSFLNGKWVREGAFVISLNTAGYLDRLTFYDNKNTAAYGVILSYNSANVAVKQTTLVNLGAGLVKYGYVSADTNSSGQIIREHNFVTYPSTVEGERYIYSYNSKGQVIGAHKLSYKSGSWQEMHFDTFSYNTSGQLVSDSIYYFNTSTSKFDLSQRTTYTYYSSGKKYVELFEFLDQATKKFTAQSRVTSYYDASGRQIRSFDELYRNAAWQGGGDDSTSFDASGYSTTLYYRYDAVAKKWSLKKKDYCASASTATVPKAPSGLTVQAIKKTNDKKLLLTWTDNSSDESGFIISRSTDGTNWVVADSVKANITTYTDTALAPAATYYYKVAAWNSAGMSSYSNSASTTTFTSVSSAVFENNIRLYPNPSNGFITLEFSDDLSESSGIMIMDITGKLVYSSIAPVGLKNIGLDLSGLPQGIYTLQIRNHLAIGIQKLVLQK